MTALDVAAVEWARDNWPTFDGRCQLAGIDSDRLSREQIAALALTMIRERA